MGRGKGFTAPAIVRRDPASDPCCEGDPDERCDPVDVLGVVVIPGLWSVAGGFGKGIPEVEERVTGGFWRVAGVAGLTAVPDETDGCGGETSGVPVGGAPCAV